MTLEDLSDVKCVHDGTKKRCEWCNGQGDDVTEPDTNKRYECFQSIKDYYERMMEYK